MYTCVHEWGTLARVLNNAHTQCHYLSKHLISLVWSMKNPITKFRTNPDKLPTYLAPLIPIPLHYCPNSHLPWGGKGKNVWRGDKWGQCKIKFITSSYATDLIGERDSVWSLSSPIIRPVRDPSDARLIRRTLMKLAKQLLFLDGWACSVAGVGSICGGGVGELERFLGKERGRACGIAKRRDVDLWKEKEIGYFSTTVP